MNSFSRSLDIYNLSYFDETLKDVPKLDTFVFKKWTLINLLFKNRIPTTKTQL